MKRLAVPASLVALLTFSGSALADELSGADTAWILTSTALVLFMTLPGLALFYGGLVRSKNVLSVLMQCFAITCVATIVWVVVGYSIAFGDGGSANAWWGGLSRAFLADMSRDALSGTIPETVFSMFQLTFAIITPALIVGGFAERMRFFRHPVVFRHLVITGLSADMPLGLGRRLARRNGTARFCWWHRGAYHGRCGSHCHGHGHRQPQGLSRQRADSA